MLREEVKALCDVMGANLQIKPESIRGHMKSKLNWAASITHPDVPFCYAVRNARSNHRAAKRVLEMFLDEFEKDKKLYGKFWISHELRKLIDAATMSSPPPSKTTREKLGWK